MEDTLMFIDDGFFGLVKKHFQKEDKKISISVINPHFLYNSFSLTSKYIAFAYFILFVAPFNAISSAP
jgi:hypothetical protein